MPDEQFEQVEENVIPEGEQLVEEEPPELMAVPEPQAEAEETVQEEAPIEQQWRNDQYAIGKAMGLEPEQVRAFADPSAFDAVANQWAETVQKSMSESPEVQQEQEAAQTAASQQQNRTAFEFTDPSDYDPELVEMNKFYNDKIDNMENTLSAVLMHTQRMQMEAAGREMDLILNNMDEGLYGRGRLNDLNEENALNRISVADEVARMGKGYLARGEGIPPMDALVERAAQSVHVKEMSQAALQRVSDKASQVARQATALPQHRDGGPETGYEAAVQAAANWQAEHGMSSY